MFITPPPRGKMVSTRSAARTDPSLKVEKHEVVEASDQQQPSGSQNITSDTSKKEAKSKKSNFEKHVEHFDVPTESRRTSEKSRRVSSIPSTTSSSKLARRKQLEYEAAAAKARIQMELIDKKLQADMANMEKYSPQNSIEEDRCTNGTEIEEWLERSNQELESQRRVHKNGKNKKDEPCPPTNCDVGTERTTVQQLVTALKELTHTSVSSGHNANLLSRISTPRELPIFSGDPADWLEFKQAFHESTQVCKFSPTENLWRLRKCLRGAAKEAVTALLLSASSPEIVMSTLELQFGNPDIILSRILLDIKKMPSMSHEYHKDIVQFSTKVKNYVAAVEALGRQEYLQGVSITKILLSKLPTVLLSKWTDYSYPLISQGAKSQLIILSEFLYNEAIKVSHTCVNLLNLPSGNYNKKIYEKQRNQNDSLLLHSTQSDENCNFCKKSVHKLPDCKKFKKSMRKDRWFFVKRNGICYKCLVSNHARDNCPAISCDIDNCGQAHHRMLHFIPGGHSRQNNSDNAMQNSESSAVVPAIKTVTCINKNCTRVLLKCVPINIHGPNGVISANALLDDGSTVSLISSELASQVGLCGRNECMRVRGAWDGSELECNVQLIDVSVSNREGTKFSIRVRSVNNLNLPVQDLSSVKCSVYAHLNKIKNYNMCTDRIKPELLIGQDNYHLILPLEVIAGKPNEPCATYTPLGWCLHGQVPQHVTSRSRKRNSTLFISDHVMQSSRETDSERLLREMNDEVRRSFTVESMGVSATPRQNTEELRALKCLEETSILENGRWYVGLPWKDRNCKMVDSFEMAMSRLRNLEKKLNGNNDLCIRYKERILHLLENDYAKEIIKPQFTPKTWYLPHFGIDNPNKKKLRLVFDAAACANGQSLNNYLLTGPDLLVSLFGIMLRFRENAVAVTGDIRDMFLRVKIRPQDQDVFRFLWRDNPSEEVRTFVMTSLIFGANCSPFIAQFIKNKNAQRFESTKRSAAQAIYTQHYMDDYIDSLPNDETAIELVKDIIYIHKQGGFDIRNWTSNSEKLLSSIPKDMLGSTAVRFKIDQQCGERTLGLIWHPHNDTFGFDTFFKRIPEEIVEATKKPTKREMLRIIMSIFDVYGFISPFTINGKILLQETWRLNIQWDDLIPESIFNKWREWLYVMKTINSISLPRCYLACTSASETDCEHLGLGTDTRVRETARASGTNAPNSKVSQSATSATQRATKCAPTYATTNVSTCATMIDNNTCSHSAVCAGRTQAAIYTNLQLHIFCDASTKAMCAVAYWRWSNNNRIQVAFICSKCRVAPIKHISVPRLELQAALMAARLAHAIIEEHRIKPTQTFFWSDSTTVLYWIHNNSRNYKAYVAHRLGEIDELSRGGEWRYVPTKINIADVATRGINSPKLPKEWFDGPSFLTCKESVWPCVTKFNVEEQKLECVTILHQSTENMCILSVYNCPRANQIFLVVTTTSVYSMCFNLYLQM
ncbi:uncharacterized protein LOC115441955 [Manduca sexta]|uniref:uncharacterized protein LOC115441955 n=1 Tax=Manduca sexta TaxID=7130 RepID=UPI00188E1027|nr:uncharacterized protein LOC115441955 [Manduca sexta]